MSAVTYKFTEARTSLKAILDTADRQGLSTISRNNQLTAVVNGTRLRRFFASTIPSVAQLVYEDGAWAAFIPGLPIAAEATTVDEALLELVDGLRDYAEAWEDRLSLASNHAENWGLVQFINLSTDEELADWLVGKAS